MSAREAYEAGLVFSLIRDPAWSWEEIDKAQITPAIFRHSDTRSMLQKLFEMREKDKPIDQGSLALELPNLSQAVWRLSDKFLAPNPPDLISKLLESEKLYQIADLTQALTEQLNNPDPDPDAIADYALQTLNKVSDKTFTNKSQTLRQAALAIIDDLDNPPDFIPTPWAAINEALGGLRKGALYVIAARPGIGKSLIGLQLAKDIAKTERQVAFFSLEMTGAELATRALANEASIEISKIDRRNLTKQEKGTVGRAGHDLPNSLHLDAIPSRQVSELRPNLRAIRATNGSLEAVFIDYLGLLEAPGQSLYEKVTKISGQLKSLAMELNIPIVALAQLNRKAEERPGAPSLADLRDSGAIEQDADAVLMLSNDESGHLSLVIAKNRQGPLGSFTGSIDRSKMIIKTFIKD